jgi:UDP-N-acetylglucosamine--N-acetylmuramyl-(pentapeptide) pyrophosphoryl-undecaprenol N-acetylglucosamine transferase
MDTRGRKNVLFAGGGTAGHLVPAINIALAMRSIDDTTTPLFIGKRNGIEREMVERFGFDIMEIDVVGMRRTPVGFMKFVLNWRRGYRQTLRIMEEFEPLAVVGTGGYVSAPAVRAAHKLNIPIYIQEQNSLPGLTTRIGNRYAEIVFTAYEAAEKYLDAEKCQLVGNPIRQDIISENRESAYRQFDLDSQKNTLLVMGGSSGAENINRIIAEMILEQFFPENWQVLWQTGRRNYPDISRSVPVDRLNGAIVPFIDDMPAAYAIADLVLSRAGAMALSEISAIGLPPILIPYPYATGDHQTMNAKRFEDAGAATVVSEKQMNKRLRNTLNYIMADDNLRMKMSAAARKMGRPDAAKVIARTILDRIK